MRKKMDWREWQELISNCRRSGMGVKQWCQGNGISVSTYYLHARKLKQMQMTSFSDTARDDKAGLPEVVRVQIIDDPPEAGEEKLENKSPEAASGMPAAKQGVKPAISESYRSKHLEATLCLCLPGGISLEMTNQVDIKVAAEILRSLRELC